MIHGTVEWISGRKIKVTPEDGSSAAVHVASRDVTVQRGYAPNAPQIELNEIKNGSTVRLHGPPKGDLHTIVVVADPPQE